MSDNTKRWILKEVLPLVVVAGGTAGGSVLWVTSELADVRSDLSAEIAQLRSELSEDIADLRERVASVEVKMDLLSPGLQGGMPE